MATDLRTKQEYLNALCGTTGLSKQQCLIRLAGLTKLGVRFATVAVLPAVTYENGTAGVGATLTADDVGALSVDGVAVALNDRVLVKNQASALQNGVYVVSTLGDAETAFILTRATDYDVAAEIITDTIIPVSGVGSPTVANTYWKMDRTGATVVGTTVVSFTQVAGIGSEMTGQDAALNYAALSTRGTTQEAMKKKAGSSVAGSDNVVFTTQDNVRRI